MKVLLIGIGAAGNKAVVQAINDKVVTEEDCIIISRRNRGNCDAEESSDK